MKMKMKVQGNGGRLGSIRGYQKALIKLRNLNLFWMRGIQESTGMITMA